MVHLAFHLKRYSEAIRYAVDLPVTDPQEIDTPVLLKLGSQLAEAGDWERAAALYEKVLVARAGEQPLPADVYLAMEMGRLEHLVGKYAEAAKNFDRVMQALDDPSAYGMDEAAKAKFLKDQGPTYVLFGESYLMAGRLANARAAFAKADALAPDPGLLGFNLAAWT